MFGALRFVLASTVVIFHAGVLPGGLWIGVSAVVVFYILSGYVITALLEARFPSNRAIGQFFAERFVRIAPQYYFWLAVAFLYIFGLHFISTPAGAPGVWTIVSYITLLPVSLQPYIHAVDFSVLSIVTSLSVECVIYLIAPFVVRTRLASGLAVAACLVIFLLSATRVLPATKYTYYFAPAQLVFFLLGSFIYRREWKMLGVSAGVLAAILALGHYLFLYPEMLIGVLIGLPAIFALRSRVGGRWDAILGNISYGCFLAQEAVFYTLLHFGALKGTPVYVGLALVLSWAAGFGSYWLVERPTIAYRRHFRARRAVSAAQVSASPAE